MEHWVIKKNGNFLDQYSVCFSFFGILVSAFELPPLGDYLSFSVLIAISPRMIPMIQNRTMIFGSAQPFNSK